MRILFLLSVCWLLAVTPVLSQSNPQKQLAGTLMTEAQLHIAIKSAYAASVRMWGIDTSTQQRMSAQFSGVVVSADGYILTAAHTTMPGKTYLVMFPDGKTAIGLALGKIELAEDRTIPDVALMKILTPGVWPVAPMGYSSSLKEGQLCISIAYPESLNQPLPSVRVGHITHPLIERGFIQSTCIMEPGDSGGPLFDERGRVIGLHSAINPPEDINYEIPVDLYRQYWTALQVADTYSALPATDAVGRDPLLGGKRAYPSLFTKDLVFPSVKPDNVCLWISSSLKGKAQRVYGTLWQTGGKGWVVSKSSMVGDRPVVIYNNKQVEAVVVARDRENDLVLLRPVSPLKGGLTSSVPVADSLSFEELGHFLQSARPDTAATVSVVGSLPFSLPKTGSMGFLGASVPFRKGVVTLNFVRPGSPAAVQGLQEGDEVVSINGTTIDKPETYGQTLQQYWPGDTISITLKHAGNAYTRQIVLTERPPMPPSQHPAEMFNGGKSIRRDGFVRVFTHDAILTPEQCGGPVFAVNGTFVGMNIARYSRTSTLVVPAKVVAAFVKQQAK